MVAATPEPFHDVVGLEPIPALTTVHGTTPVSGQHMATEPRGEVGEGLSHRHQAALTRDRVEFDLPGAEKKVQGLRTHPWTGEHGKTGLSRFESLGEVLSLQGDDQQRLGTSSVLPFSASPGQGVGTDGGKSIGIPLPEGSPAAVGEGWEGIGPLR